MTDHQTQIVKILDYFDSLDSYTINQNTSQAIAPSINVSYQQPHNPHYSSKNEFYQLQIRDTSKENRETVVKKILQLDTRYPNGYSKYYNDTAPYLTFTNDANDSTPTEITDVDANVTEGVVSDYGGKTKVYSFKQTSSSTTQAGFTIAFDEAQTTLSIEFYLYVVADSGLDVSKALILYLDDTRLLDIWTYAGAGDPSQYIRLWRDGPTYDQTTTFSINGGWHHWRIEISAGANTVYFDGTSKQTNAGFAAPSFSALKYKLYRQTQFCYLEGIDFSWVDGYYTNRNISGTLSVDTNYPYYIETEMVDEWDTEAIMLLKARWVV